MKKYEKEFVNTALEMLGALTNEEGIHFEYEDAVELVKIHLSKWN